MSCDQPVRALLFDLDNTLTPPRRALESEMADTLARLALPFHVVAGSNLALVCEQLLEPLRSCGYRGTFDAFVCNGSDRYRCHIGVTVGTQLVRSFDFRSHVGATEFESVLRVIERVLRAPEFRLPPSVPVIGERIQDRGSMLNVAPIGRPATMTPAAYDSRAAFMRFDAESGYRRRLLARLNAELAHLRASKALRITLGGQTSFDLVIEGNDKRYPLRVLLAEGYVHLTYFGDALFEGGNDAAVLEFIRAEPEAASRIAAVAVSDWRETMTRLRELRVLLDR